MKITLSNVKVGINKIIIYFHRMKTEQLLAYPPASEFGCLSLFSLSWPKAETRQRLVKLLTNRCWQRLLFSLNRLSK